MDSGIAVVLQTPCRISSTILVRSAIPVYLNNTAMLVLRLTSLERYVFLRETFALENKLLLYCSDTLLLPVLIQDVLAVAEQKIQGNIGGEGFAFACRFQSR